MQVASSRTRLERSPHYYYHPNSFYISILLCIIHTDENPQLGFTPDENAKIKELQYHTVHALIDDVLAKVPLAPALLLKQISNSFPTRTGPNSRHEDYIDNLLKITGIDSTNLLYIYLYIYLYLAKKGNSLSLACQFKLNKKSILANTHQITQ